MSKKKNFKVGQIVKFVSDAHHPELNDAVVKITDIRGVMFNYDIIFAPNTTRKFWNTWGDNFTDEVEYYSLTKLEKIMYETAEI